MSFALALCKTCNIGILAKGSDYCTKCKAFFCSKCKKLHDKKNPKHRRSISKVKDLYLKT